MDNIQEIFTYQSVPATNNATLTTHTSNNGATYTNMSSSKEIYSSTLPNLNVQHFNYDPNTQWISMPVIPNSQTHPSSHIQQIPQQQHMQTGAQIQIQTPGVSVQRTQTVQYQQPTGETINLAIIQPLFIVNDQQGLIQHLEAVPPTQAEIPPQQSCESVPTELPALTVVTETSFKPRRKPKRPPEVIQAQREEYVRKKIERHSVKPACHCKLRCAEKLSEARRVCINKQYWQLPYDKQRDFILHSVEILDVKRRKKKSQLAILNSAKKGDESTNDREQKEESKECTTENEDGDFDEENPPPNGKQTTNETSSGVEKGDEEECPKKFRRGWSRVYSLKGDDGKFLTVCKAMFLTTLGFPENVDGALRFLNKQQRGDIRARSPQRGKATPMKGATAKIDREVIKNHILSYKPVVVGRKKGQIRYLPGDLSMKKMHSDFKAAYTERNVSYTIYSEVFRSLNIVFRKDPKMTAAQGSSS